MNRTKSVLLIAAAMMLLMIVGPVSAGTIKLGFHAPLTGFAVSDGKSATEGAGRLKVV